MAKQRKGRRRKGRKRYEAPAAISILLIGTFILLALVFLADVAQVIQNAPWLLALAGVLIVGIVALLVWLRVRRRQRWLAHVRTLGDLLMLTPTQFELAIGELLTSWGYRDVRHTGGGGDLAADLTCRTPDGQFAVVQCKRFAPDHKVDSPEVQKFIGMLTVHHRAQLGIFVTTSSFTQPALTLAHQHNLRTIDGQELTQHIQQMQTQVEAKHAAR